MEEQEVLLNINNLTIQYVTDDFTIHAVNGLGLKILRATTLGLVGETGAGKTTTARAIMGLLGNTPAKFVSGEIVFDGNDLLKRSGREMRRTRGAKVSMIFQDPMTALNPLMSVGDQIAEVILLHQTKDKKEARKIAGDLLEMVGIDRSRLTEYPHEFSGGMKQRVVIAMALSCKPELLIADEPTTALDVTIQAQVLALMKKLKDQYRTSMLMITHDLGIVAEICDYVAVIYAGTIVEYGNIKQIMNSGRHPYTQGLFACIPDLFSDESELTPIKGLMADPVNLPTGCKFHPRCRYANDICAQKIPANYEVEQGHFVRCDRLPAIEREVQAGGDYHG